MMYFHNKKEFMNLLMDLTVFNGKIDKIEINNGKFKRHLV